MSNKKYNFPVDYTMNQAYLGDADQALFEQIVNLGIDEMVILAQELGVDIFKVEKGVIHISMKMNESAGNKKDGNQKDDEEEGKMTMELNLNNMLRSCKTVSDEEKKRVVANYFSQVKKSLTDFLNKKETYVLKDFDYSKNLLVVQVREAGYVNNTNKGTVNMISREDIPHTVTLLGLDYDEGFRYLQHNDIKEWGVPLETLWEIAYENVKKHPVQIEVLNNPDKQFEMKVINTPNYASTQVLYLEEIFELPTPNYGVLFVIPARNSAFVHIIDKLFPAQMFIQNALQISNHFYRKMEYPVTPYLFWYYKKKFYAFEQKIDEEKGILQLEMPEKLHQIFQMMTHSN